MHNLKTVSQEWEEFWDAISVPGIEEIQRQEMRKAFYAGCQSMLTLVSVISAQSATEEIGALKLEAVQKELLSFAKAVLAGEA